MSNTYRYGFILAKTTGFAKNYGWVKYSFYDEDTLAAQHMLKDGEVIWYVDATKFSEKHAEELADKKAQELFGEDPVWLLDALEVANRGIK